MYARTRASNTVPAMPRGMACGRRGRTRSACCAQQPPVADPSGHADARRPRCACHRAGLRSSSGGSSREQDPEQVMMRGTVGHAGEAHPAQRIAQAQSGSVVPATAPPGLLTHSCKRQPRCLQAARQSQAMPVPSQCALCAVRITAHCTERCCAVAKCVDSRTLQGLHARCRRAGCAASAESRGKSRSDLIRCAFWGCLCHESRR